MFEKAKAYFASRNKTITKLDLEHDPFVNSVVIRPADPDLERLITQIVIDGKHDAAIWRRLERFKRDLPGLTGLHDLNRKWYLVGKEHLQTNTENTIGVDYYVPFTIDQNRKAVMGMLAKTYGVYLSFERQFFRR